LEKIMTRKYILIAATLLISVLLLTYCNLPARQSSREVTATPTTRPEETVSAPVLSSTETAAPTPTRKPTMCDNTYQPARSGDTWVYQGSNTARQSYTRTDKVVKSATDAFNVESTVETITYSVDYSCTEAGLVANNPIQQYLGALLATPSSNLEVTLISASGVSLPARIDPGDQWQQVAEADAKINGTPTNGRIIFDYNAIGIEEVRVPAGTYEAMRVDTEIRIEVTLFRIPAGSYALTMWLAPDVGIIKTEGTSHVTGIEFSDALELVEFTPAP
jgi:hypothetical protein